MNPEEESPTKPKSSDLDRAVIDTRPPAPAAGVRRAMNWRSPVLVLPGALIVFVLTAGIYLGLVQRQPSSQPASPTGQPIVWDVPAGTLPTVGRTETQNRPQHPESQPSRHTLKPSI